MPRLLIACSAPVINASRLWLLQNLRALWLNRFLRQRQLVGFLDFSLNKSLATYDLPNVGWSPLRPVVDWQWVVNAFRHVTLVCVDYGCAAFVAKKGRHYRFCSAIACRMSPCHSLKLVRHQRTKIQIHAQPVVWLLSANAM